MRLTTQPALMVQPNPFEHRDETVRAFVESLLWHGNAYVMSLAAAGGRPIAVAVLDPNEVTVTPDKHRRPSYQYRNTELVPGVDVWHSRLTTLPGELVGVSPLTSAANVIAGNVAADTFGRSLFEEGAIPSGTLTHPGSLTKQEADILTEQWLEAHADSRRPAILSGGVTYSAMSLTPEQAQFIMTRSYGSQEVSRLLGIPQWLLNAGSPPGSGSSLTYQNLSAVFLELTKATIDPTYLRRLAAVFSAMMPRGLSVGFDIDALTRSDREARYRAWDTALGSQPFMTTAEVRAREGLDPAEEVTSARAVRRDAADSV